MIPPSVITSPGITPCLCILTARKLSSNSKLNFSVTVADPTTAMTARFKEKILLSDQDREHRDIYAHYNEKQRKKRKRRQQFLCQI